MLREDQIPRRRRFETAHPGVRIWQSPGGCWYAEAWGREVGPIVWLGDLLDALELLVSAG